MRRVRSAVAAMVAVLLLASCSFNPLSWIPRDYPQLAADRMVEIVDAVNGQNAAALKEMFTEFALTEYSAEIDDGLTYLLSLFPDGDLVWENTAYRSPVSHSTDEGRRMIMVPAQYRVSSAGKDYWLFFSDYVVNDIDPSNVGIYGLGVAPRTETKRSGPEDVFFAWEGSVSGHRDNGPPGVYVPTYTSSELSDRTMEEIAEDLNSQDVSGLRVDTFSELAQTQHAGVLDDEIDALFKLFPSDDLVWEAPPEGPVVREKAVGDDQTILLLPTYRVSAGGKDYWLFFADFTVNTIDPDNLGVYAIGVAARTASGDSAQEQALFTWADTFDVDAIAPAGVAIFD